MCVDEIYGISRLQYTIPQEFGLYTQFLCVMYLIRFMRKKQDSKEKRDDLFLFMMSLAASLAIHFYVTIMAFFLCGSFAVFGITKIFQKKNFGRLLAAVIAGVIISTMPMVLAFVSGTPLQGSLNWGMNIINGTDTKEGRTQVAQSITDESNMEEAAQNLIDNNGETQQNQLQMSSDGDAAGQNGNAVQVQKKVSLQERLKKIIDDVKLVYKYGYAQLYGSSRAVWLLRFTLIALVLGVLNTIVSFIRFRKVPFEMYWGITFASVVFMVLYAAPFLGLPEIIAGARLCLTEQVLLLAMMAIPVDQLLFLLGKTKAGSLAPYVSVLGVAAIYAGTNYFGVFHGYLYYELTRYNSAVELTNSIIDEYPQYMYTIISTTEEMYQAIESGRHEELLDFYYKSKQEQYYIPTEYLFFYVEKEPIYYAQYHFFSGPSWLAQSKYTKYYEYSNAVLSQGDDIKNEKISEKLVGEPLAVIGKASDAYSNIKNRQIIESEINDWCMNFKSCFPNEMKTYYEDENFVCYVIKQNPDRLYDLSN